MSVPMNTLYIQDLLRFIRVLMKNAAYCFLITHSSQGEMHARLMQPFLPEEDLSVWFGASRNSRKVREIEANHLVTLTYFYQAEYAYLSVQGRASLSDDRALRKQYWREEWFKFWPGGPEQEDYSLIQVKPYHIEIMDLAQGIAPEPYGLRPLILVKEREQWVVRDDSLALS
ncbi:MAG TPA: pyridoxamine 5'-phosphate oxidase family protein [Levilinea sp.]|nr:pyridoxamine 5'-phosphate oxidase family protein [Levilinea sp.]